MYETAIRVENLGKMYRIGAAHTRHDTLREALMARFGRNGRPKKDELIWALKNVSFEVKRGEAIGIIGRNGAGKSTLLKILSRITEPTTGRAEIYGRVGSLLEVGTGFHPELTGRENIYLSGAIMGMRRTEIERKFDEIAAFSEIERFLDTPVKRYSSGMYVRLAFAVAAHLDPEILLVDEVLAVGDAAFQKKCLGRMEGVAKEGRTVLFVSHNMAAVKHLCQRGLVLNEGSIAFIGSGNQAVEFYKSRGGSIRTPRSNELSFDTPDPEPGQRFEVLKVQILNERGEVRHSLCTGEYARFRIEWRASSPVERGGVELGIHTLEGIPLIQYSTRPVSDVDVKFATGRNAIECEFQSFPLAAGRYYISVALTRPMMEWLYRDDHFGLLEVGERDVFQTGTPIRTSRACLVVPHQWIKL